MAGKNISITQIAEKAGVSKSTVSLVLQQDERVNEKTRQRILDIMQEVGYVYNRQAAAIRGVKNNVVGLIFHDIVNPFFSVLASTIQKQLFQKHYVLLLASSNDDCKLESQLFNAMLEHNVRGILISPTIHDNEQLIARINHAGLPVIQISRFFKHGSDGFPVIKADNQHAVYGACEYLYQQGCRKIAFLGGVSDAPLTGERYAGYAEFVSTHQLPSHHLFGSASKAFGYNVIMRLLMDYSADAIVCFNDLVALGAHQRLQAEGVRVGEAVKLFGFDNISDCELVSPGLSTIGFCQQDIGKIAADMMLNWIEKEQIPPPQHIIKTELVLRGSA